MAGVGVREGDVQEAPRGATLDLDEFVRVDLAADPSWHSSVMVEPTAPHIP